MYFKSMTLYGFKSFYSKINLIFDCGITAIVGPNGSGKSNIADAIRWVLGEQSTKNLRSSKMEDVIFCGTAHRKPLGFAEVSIVFDNTEKFFNVEFSEITITRRLYRSGESNYFINNSQCRLKDISEILMDTGIGKDGYSIIGQGQIDEILNAKSEDRRFLFEEAAGITKFRHRRDEALQKLEREKNNLIRLMDIIEELEKKLKPLEIQSNNAKYFLKLNDELKTIKINIFLKNVDSKQEELSKFKNNKENLLLQISKTEQDILKIDKQIYDLESNLDASLKNLEKYKNISMNIKLYFENNKNKKKSVLEQNDFLMSNIHTIQHSLKNEKKLLDKLFEDQHNLSSDLKNLQLQLDEKNLELNKAEKEVYTTKTNILEYENFVEKSNINIIEFYKRQSQLKYDESNLKSLLSNLETKKNENFYKFIDLTKKNKFYRASICSLKNSIEIIKNDEKILCKQIIDLENINKNLTYDLNLLKQNKLDTVYKLNEIDAKIKILEDFQNNYEGYYTSTKIILKESNNKNSKLSGILGAVGQLIEVEKNFEIAIETCLGSKIHNIITNNENDAKNAIKFLKNISGGRATFLPISSIKISKQSKFDFLLSQEGVCNIAKNVVKYKNIFENIFCYLLGSIVICRDIDIALKIAQKYKNSFKIVTLDGNIVSTDGAITGGSLKQKTTSIFSKSSEIKTLNINKNNFFISLNQLDEKIKKIEFDIFSNTELIGNKKLELDEFLNSIKISNFKYESFNNDLDQNKILLSNLSVESLHLDEQILDISSKLKNKILDLENTENEIITTRQAFQKYQDLAIVEKEFYDNNNVIVNEIKMQVNNFNNQILSKQQVFLKIEQDIKNIKNNIINIQDDLKNKEEKLYENKNNIYSIDKKIHILDYKSKEYQDKILDLEKLVEDSTVFTKKLITSKNNLAEIINNLMNEKTRLDVNIEYLDKNTRQLYDEIWESYNMTYQQALKFKINECNLKKMYNQEKDLKENIKNLGNINISAIDEFEETNNRYLFLTNQKNDIIEAEQNLKKLIKQLTFLMTSQFKDKFELISKNFDEVFKKIFGGGEAHLKIKDNENLLESGIDIIAKPPGKNLQTISLMSGGEKALTAISILFAILEMKPSPFCILDEIEASLDNENIRRFGDYLKNLSNKIQFIIITHRKSTMEFADVIYGVTMHEQGISKMISININ